MNSRVRSKTENRFEFGKNWNNFIKRMTPQRIASAKQALADMTGLQNFSGKTFLDVGSGSGLSSLAAWQMGAKVFSFDYDPDSVAATKELRRRFGAPEAEWAVQQGSVLDAMYLQSFATYDIVYSWGVLHHTGSQWVALDNVSGLVKPGGLLYIALYNDQGGISLFWRLCKRIYVSGTVGRIAILALTMVPITLFQCLKSFVQTRNPLRHHLQNKERGMSPFHDVLDWVGGYPFETAKPEQVLQFLRKRNFVLENIITTNGHGNNEFLFRREERADCPRKP